MSRTAAVARVSSGAEFSPSELAPAIWADFQDASKRFQSSGLTTPAVAVNDPLGGIVDASGNGRNFLQTVNGSRPTLQQVTNNGKTFWVGRGDGVDDWMVETTFNRTQPYTVAIVLRCVTLAGYIFGSVGSAGGALYPTNSGIFQFENPTSLFAVASPASFGALIFRANGANSAVFVNGLKTTGYSGSINYTGMTLFSRTAGNSPSNVEIAEVCGWSREITDAEANLMQGYLKGRYGTP